MQIGVLTGGGDAPGLNAALRAIVFKAATYGDSVVGFRHGWMGLLGNGDAEFLTPEKVEGILPVGGTMLGTSRTNPLKIENGIEQVKANLKKYSINVLVAIGGEDTLGIAAKLHEIGVPVVGVPKTIDNDLAETDYCLGFDSAVSNVADAIDKVHTTAHAHHRVMVVEVMGRDAGWMAVVGGMAGGADFIAIPEEPSTMDEVYQHIYKRWASGKNFSILVVAEGAKIGGIEEGDYPTEKDAFGHARLDKRGIGARLAQMIEEKTGFETRATVLGYVQRGGSPTAFDRVLATRLGAAAVDFIHQDKLGHMPAIKGNKIVPVLLADAVGRPQQVDLEIYHLAKIFY